MLIDDVKAIVGAALNLDKQLRAMDASSRLHGVLPELDSMAVVTIIAALEDRFGFAVSDNEIDSDTFATLGSLCAFVERKLAA